MKIKKLNAGMTLTEIMIVLIIVTLLTGLAIPKYNLMNERFKSKEGYRILFDVYGAQKRYAIDHNGTYTTNMSDLDVEVRTPKYFLTPDPVTPVVLPGGSKFYVVSITELNSRYVLYITTEGLVACAGDGTTSLCSKMGYKYPAQL